MIRNQVRYFGETGVSTANRPVHQTLLQRYLKVLLPPLQRHDRLQRQAYAHFER